MRMNARSCYAVAVAAALAESHAEGRPLSVGALAGRVGAPRKFLAQVLRGLRDAGVVESLRGPDGGFRLARPPGETSVGKVLRASGGGSGYIGCGLACDRALDAAGGEGLASRALCHVLSEMERSLARTLDALTFGELVERAGRPWPPPDYQI